MSESIVCPKCGKKIELTEAFSSQIEEKLRKEFEAEERKQQKQFDEALAEQSREAQARLLKERESTEKQAKKKAEEAVSLEVRDLKEQLDEKAKLLKTAEQHELALRKKERELEERERSQKIEFERKADEQRKAIWEEARNALTEENHLKDLDSNRRLAEMKKQIEELKSKVDQGSQQAQGEVLELELEDLLRARFPHDEFAPVGKGLRGGDIIQKIHAHGGAVCGQILWEFKRTKAWSDSWIPKLKDDQRAAGADIAVIVSTTLPKDIRHFAQLEGVWVTDTQCVYGLASALRNGLIQTADARTALVGKSDKMEMMYSYLSGPEFRRRIEAIMESFVSMKHDLDAERRAIEKIWAKREKQIQRVIQNTGGMYGDVQGIVGASLPEINLLELPTEEPEEGF